jgi:hypothetical protein
MATSAPCCSSNFSPDSVNPMLSPAPVIEAIRSAAAAMLGCATVGASGSPAIVTIRRRSVSAPVARSAIWSAERDAAAGSVCTTYREPWACRRIVEIEPTATSCSSRVIRSRAERSAMAVSSLAISRSAVSSSPDSRRPLCTDRRSRMSRTRLVASSTAAIAATTPTLSLNHCITVRPSGPVGASGRRPDATLSETTPGASARVRRRPRH